MPHTTRMLALLGMMGVWLVPSSWAAGPADLKPEIVTSLADLDRQTKVNQTIVFSLRIEGTVWWSSKTEGRVILNDDSTTLQLELNLPCQMPDLGDRLILEGACTATKSRDVIRLSGVPVVDHDGLHPPEEKSGTVYLEAGIHPIRVAWFDRTDRYGLSVSYEGPDLPRQQIPGETLFRLETDAVTGKTNFVSGLDYRSCEGMWWRHLPNFDHISAVKTGNVDHFDITVRSRDGNVGVQFTGYLNVARDGEYTFYVWSDDGSRLFIGEPTLRVLNQGTASRPPSKSIVKEGVPEEEAEFQWSETDGIVTSFLHLEESLDIDLITETGPVRIKLAEDSDCSFSLRPNNRIKAVGVGRKIFDLEGRFTRSEFYVQHWDDIEQKYIVPSIWTEYPLTEISSLLTLETSNSFDSVVYLNGIINWADTGESMMLQDQTGRVILDDPVPEDRVGRSSDVLGLLSLDGSNLVLRCALYYQLGEHSGKLNNLPVLTTAEQVCQLSLEEADRSYPVRLRGVITSPNKYEGAAFQDSSRGIYLWFPKPDDVLPVDWRPIAVQKGDYCEIEGVTALYQFNPFIQVSKIQILGAGTFPDPIRPAWDQLINGSMQCNYVELEGVITSCKDDSISLLTRDGRINIRLNPIGPAMPQDALGATVRISGTLFADLDEESRRVLVGSIYLDQQRLTIVQPAPVAPFSIPLKRVGELLQFDPQAGALQRVRVSGLLLHSDAAMSHMSDDGNGLRFVPLEPVNANIGDRIEVVGFADFSGPSPRLQDAVVRRLAPAGLPIPKKLMARGLVRDDYDSTLVQVEGVLLNISPREEGAVFEMQAGLHRFMAMVGEIAELDVMPKPGSRLELTGVYVGQGGNRVLGQPINSFNILIDTGRDVRVLSRPPWWTFRRVMTAFALLIGVLMAALVWINLLHQKVEQRTAQLGDQIRQRQRVEHERAIEQERSRLAHDLHDDLGAGLTEMNILSSLVNNPAIAVDKKNNYASKMSELAHRMVGSLDEIVWAENPLYDTVFTLADFFESYARRLLEPASVGCIFTVADNVPDHPLDPRIRQEIFLTFKEALTNVVKHAGASAVQVNLSVEGDDLLVILSDDGCGIKSERHAVGADGIANMQARLAAVGGRCDIQSDPEKGTTVRIRAPIKGLIS